MPSSSLAMPELRYMSLSAHFSALLLINGAFRNREIIPSDVKVAFEIKRLPGSTALI